VLESNNAAFTAAVATPGEGGNLASAVAAIVVNAATNASPKTIEFVGIFPIFTEFPSTTISDDLLSILLALVRFIVLFDTIFISEPLNSIEDCESA